jgi:hypothetical protein
MITSDRPIAAPNALRCCRSRLHEIRLDALTAATALSGARANRTHELADKLADVLAHCERLTFILEGDLCDSESLVDSRSVGAGVLRLTQVRHSQEQGHSPEEESGSFWIGNVCYPGACPIRTPLPVAVDTARWNRG